MVAQRHTLTWQCANPGGGKGWAAARTVGFYWRSQALELLRRVLWNGPSRFRVDLSDVYVGLAAKTPLAAPLRVLTAPVAPKITRRNMPLATQDSQ